MKILHFLNKKGEEVFLIGIISCSVVLLFLQVIMRYVFKNSISWSEELARYLFLWMIWVGASMAAKESRHLKAEFLENLVSEKVMRIISIAALILWLAFSLWVTCSSFFLTRDIYRMNQKSSAMQMPMFIPYASVPAGCGLMSIRLIQNLLAVIKQRKES
ncbi:MAG: TRAP transporter small permease [Peptostreptococcaceae bacterium]|nr:TRAP transporter small permease [Peptostreptococcaceae bacterium]